MESEGDSRSNSVKQRVKTALILVGIVSLPIILAAFFDFGRVFTTALALVAVLGAVAEYQEIVREERKRGVIERLLFSAIIVLPTSTMLGFLISDSFWANSVSITPAFFVLSGSSLLSFFLALQLILVFGYRSLDVVESESRHLYSALMLIGVGGSALLYFAASAEVYRYIPWLAAVVCVNDIAAFFAGSYLSGPKMSPALSPNKTVSGGLAGLILGTGLGVLLFPILNVDLSTVSTLLLTYMVVLSAQMGDLTKSAVKRFTGVKDSGSLLPGHGGILDRIDGILMGALVLCLSLGLFSL